MPTNPAVQALINAIVQEAKEDLTPRQRETIKRLQKDTTTTKKRKDK